MVVFSEPIQMTPVQSSAALFRLDLGRDQYNLLREIMTEHKACILVPWYRIQEFHKTTEPEGWTCELDSNGNAVFQVPMASVIHHHIRSILENEVILARMQAHFAADPLVKFVLIFKYGADGANAMVVYRFGGSISNVFASVLAIVQLKAVSPSGATWVIYANPNVNSESSHVYLRVSYEKEYKGILQKTLRKFVKFCLHPSLVTLAFFLGKIFSIF